MSDDPSLVPDLDAYLQAPGAVRSLEDNLLRRARFAVVRLTAERDEARGLAQGVARHG